jgi:hypothetical protein
LEEEEAMAGNIEEEWAGDGEQEVEVGELE